VDPAISDTRTVHACEHVTLTDRDREERSIRTRGARQSFRVVNAAFGNTELCSALQRSSSRNSP
jgi:hypothetical protein